MIVLAASIASGCSSDSARRDVSPAEASAAFAEHGAGRSLIPPEASEELGYTWLAYDDNLKAAVLRPGTEARTFQLRTFGVDHPLRRRNQGNVVVVFRNSRRYVELVEAVLRDLR